MKPQDIFGLMVRAIALYLCIFGLWYIDAGFRYLPATIVAFVSGRLQDGGSAGYFVYGVPALMLGLALLRFADVVVRFSYHESNPLRR